MHKIKKLQNSHKKGNFSIYGSPELLKNPTIIEEIELSQNERNSDYLKSENESSDQSLDKHSMLDKTEDDQSFEILPFKEKSGKTETNELKIAEFDNRDPTPKPDELSMEKLDFETAVLSTIDKPKLLKKLTSSSNNKHDDTTPKRVKKSLKKTHN